MKKKFINFLLSLGFAITAGIFIYPSFNDSLNNILQVASINDYNSELAGYTDEEIQKMKDDAKAYNEEIFKQQSNRVFEYMGEHATDDQYESVLCPDKESTVMGYVDVPAADVYLPIAHGTKTPMLQYEAGHMYGSSVVYAGENTKSVVAGHTGLQNAEIFTNLTKVQKGDEFKLHVLDEIFVYRVRDIQVVWPEDEVPYLQVEPGKDLCTLYTCTPYGINDHRLLITGEHIDTLDANTSGEHSELRNKNIEALIRAILFAITPIIVFILMITFLAPKKKKKKRKTNGKNIQPERQKETTVL